MHVDRARLAGEREPPHVLEELVAREHDARLPAEGLEQLELLRAQRDGLTVDPDLVPRRIDAQVPDLEHAAAAGHPRRALDVVSQARSLARFIVRDEMVPAPHTSLNVPIGASRRFEFVATSLDDLKAIKSRLGGSVNDVVLAIAAGGLRRLLEARGETLPRRGVRVMVPVNMRGATEMMALGNRVSSLFVELPVAEDDPLGRYRATVEATEELKRSGLAGGAEALVEVAGIAPPAIHAALARMAFTPRLFNLTITNVPGPQTTLYALGAPMRRVIPLVPIFADHAVGFAVVSYDGEVVFGLNGDHGAMADLHVLREGLAESLAELREIVGLQAQDAPAPQVKAAV